jgi:CRISPR-associated protein Csb1
MMSKTFESVDAWLKKADGPAALVIREHLVSVEGHEGVVFPPTFAAGDGFQGGYNIDPRPPRDDPWKTPNLCIMDTVGSQANRIEPIFAEDGYADLIPQIVVKAGEKKVNLLEAGHRAGDALVRCSQLQSELRDAFRAVLLGDAELLAKISPTSIVFGVWDSRDTQAKLPRIVTSAIRAFDVKKMTRSAVYIPPVDYAELNVFSESEKAKAEGSSKSPLAQRGFVHNPASASHGGVIATGGIRRDATLSLVALQTLKSQNDESTLKLRRYILGLSLVAFTIDIPLFLRQGCNLVLDSEKPKEFVAVYRNGKREPVDLSHDEALAFAREAAQGFGVGENREVEFDKSKATEDVKKKDKGDDKKKTKEDGKQ